MEPYQWFLLGAMAAWTPGMVILAICLWRAPTEERMSSLDERQPRSFQPIIISMKRILSSDQRPPARP
jgi:hypothetical protein